MISCRYLNAKYRYVGGVFSIAALISGLFSVPAQAGSVSEPATATASGQWTITSSGWSFGSVEVTDDGGNYSSKGARNPLVTSTVNFGSLPKSREGTVTYKQSFRYAGPPLASLTFSYTLTSKAFAIISSPLQTSHAKSQSFIDEVVSNYAAEVTGTLDGATDTHGGSGEISGISPPGVYYVYYRVEADASTP